MSFSEKIKEKSVAYILFLISAAMVIISFIIYIIYVSGGGRVDAIVFIAFVLSIVSIAVLFFYNGLFADIIAALPCVCCAVALSYTLEGGVGNIADSVENIVMYGNKEIAVYNYLMAAFLATGMIVAAVACFMSRVKPVPEANEQKEKAVQKSD